ELPNGQVEWALLRGQRPTEQAAPLGQRRPVALVARGRAPAATFARARTFVRARGERSPPPYDLFPPVIVGTRAARGADRPRFRKLKSTEVNGVFRAGGRAARGHLRRGLCFGRPPAPFGVERRQVGVPRCRVVCAVVRAGFTAEHLRLAGRR